MSSLISEKIKNKYSFKKRPILNLEIKLSPILVKKNILLQKLFVFLKQKNRIDKNIEKINIFPNLDFKKYSDFFNLNGYLYLEDVIDKDFHMKLKNNWPKSFFFRPRHQIEKSYDTGFKYLRHWNTTPNIEIFPYLEKFYKSVQSEEFSKKISQLINNKFNLSCFSMTSSTAYGGSVLFPHVDDIAISHAGKNEAMSMINCIFFIYADPNNKSSGGTGIYRDNQFSNKIFEPSNLCNSLLIYKTDKDFFHGFNEMPNGSLRYAITAQFNQK